MSRIIIFQRLMVVALLLVTPNGSAQFAIAGAEVTVSLSEQVRIIVDKKREMIEVEVAGHPLIIDTVKKYNERNKGLSKEDIAKMDQAWMDSKGVTSLMQEFLAGPAAEFLIEFQEAHNGYAEIFLTDARGLNAAMTNKTSDYNQADEEWWVKCYAGGRGFAYYGAIEYDESAMSESIAVYVPVKDPGDQGVVGVIKAVIDITAIKMELQ